MSAYRKSLTDRELLDFLGCGIHEMYFIGILGAGMLPLAKLARSLGYRVSGSDVKADGVQIHDGFLVCHSNPDNIKDVSLVIASLAIAKDDPEILEAERLSVPTVTRAQLLGALMTGYRERIGVSGTHGKSTTTALIDKIFCDCGKVPTTVSGATLYDGSDMREGRRDTFIYEACEYRDAFLSFYPTVQVITSIELDHTDYFDKLSALTDSFRKCADSADIVVLNSDFDASSDFRASLGTKVYTYGRSENADYRYVVTERSAGTCRFYILKYGKKLLETSTTLLGEYNLLNATAAIAVADILGVESAVIAASVASFYGIERRMSRLPSFHSHDVFYDYAHHPTEIALAIDALKESYGECTVVFCPHTFTRTKSLWKDFILALSKSNFTILLDIYPAREKQIEGITSENLAKEIPNARFCANIQDVLLCLARDARGAVVLMGAGEMSGLIRKMENEK